MALRGDAGNLRGSVTAEEGRGRGGATAVIHSSTTAAHHLGATDPEDARSHSDADRTDASAEQRAVARSPVGWRYGSALAAARALNARRARA